MCHRCVSAPGSAQHTGWVRPAYIVLTLGLALAYSIPFDLGPRCLAEPATRLLKVLPYGKAIGRPTPHIPTQCVR